MRFKARLLLSISFLIAAPALADTAAVVPPADGGDDGAEIVVTAQGRQQRLQDVPLSATVASGEALQKSNIRDLQDLGNHVANVRITSAPASDQLHVRGVGSGLNANFEQSVGTFVDGIYRGRSRSSRAALFDVERVEILKGPQTTFFGNNAIAGALNITTRTPGDDFDYNASLLYGSDREYAVEGGVSVPVSDTLSVRLAGKAYGMNGYVKNDLTGNSGPHQRDWIGRAMLVWKPSTDFTSTLRVDRGRARDDEAYPTQAVNCAPGTSTALGLCARYIAQAGGAVDGKLDHHYAAAPSSFDYDFVEAAWRNELKLGGVTLKSLTGYFDHDVDATFNLMPLPLTGVSGTNVLFGVGSPEKYHSFSQEFRLESDADAPLSYTLGLYYSRGKLQTQSALGYFFAPLGAALGGVGYTAASPLASATSFRQTDRTLSGFAAATWRATDSLRVNGALRYSIVKKTAARSVVSGTVATGTTFPTRDGIIAGTPAQQAAINAVLAVDPAAYVDGSRTDRKLMPSIGVQYDLDRNVMAYLTYTKGFKAGGFSSTSSINLFGPENVDAYEAGVKSTLFGSKLSLNVSTFWNDFKDLQEASNFLLPNGSSLSLVQNAGRARVRGIEAGGTIRITPEIGLSADLAYLDAKYTSFPNGPCRPAQVLASPVCQQDLSGQRRQFAPKYNGNVSLNVAVPVGDNVVSFDPSLFFTSKYSQQVNNDPIFFQSGYAKVDARLAYGAADKRWEVAVIGKNLTDKTTASFRNSLQNFGSVFALVERGRSVAIQLSLRH